MDYKLSLVATVDDLARKRDALFTAADEIETCFLKFVWQQEACRQKWAEADRGTSAYQEKINELEDKNSRLDIKLKHARNQIDHEIRKRERVEQDKDGLDRNIKLVQDLLADKNQTMLNARDREKLAFLSTDFQSTNYGASPCGLSRIDESMVSPDVSYDVTGDDLDFFPNGRSSKRPSAPPVEEEPIHPGKRQKGDQKSGSKHSKSKKHRRSNSASIITTTTSVTVKDGLSKARVQEDFRQDSLRKFPSAGDIKVDSEEETTPKSGRYMKDPFTPGSSTLYRTNSSKSLTRPHYFVTKTVIKPEQCVWCGKKIKFSKAATKCRDCKATSHPECKDQVPLPCVPTTVTPNNGKNIGCTVADYAPLQPPYIPALVIHCVNEVEARGLTERGIYRLSGSEREIKELKEKFLRGRGTPNLGHITDINVVCGCLKDFLRGLKEPLLTFGLWEDFVKSAENGDNEESTSGTYQAISQLPKSNRDTIAFLIIHLQKVSESEDCEMGVTNIARVFGPTIVGYSCPEPEAMQMINETRKQQLVVEKLMSISRDYWENIMNFDSDMDSPGGRFMPDTPEVLHSMLGPVHTPGETSNKKNTWMGSTSRSVKKKPTNFFQSPVLQ